MNRELSLFTGGPKLYQCLTIQAKDLAHKWYLCCLFVLVRLVNADRVYPDRDQLLLTF